MDQRTRDVEEDLKSILHTRLALGEKVNLLGQEIERVVYTTKAQAVQATRHPWSTAFKLFFSVGRFAGRRGLVILGSAAVAGLLMARQRQRERQSRIAWS